MSAHLDIIGANERITDVVRRHWVSIVPLMLCWLAIAVVALYGFYLIGRFSAEVQQIGPIFPLVAALLALLVFAFLLARVTYWVYRENRIIITNRNVYLVTQDGLFSRQIDQFSLHNLQEVRAGQQGFMATILDYGSVTAETAGDEKNLILTYAPHPKQLAARILECHQLVVRESPKTTSP